MKAGKIGILAAIMGSLCCIGPIFLMILGLGSLGIGAKLGKYHWYFQGGAVAVLVFAWWIFLHEKKRLYALDLPIKNERLTKGLLSVVSVIVLLFLGMSAYSTLHSQPSIASNTSISEHSVIPAGMAIIAVEGMGCVSCEPSIEKTVTKLQGVKGVNADSAQGKVIVQYDPKLVSVEQLVSAINKTGYTAKMPN